MCLAMGYKGDRPRRPFPAHWHMPVDPYLPEREPNDDSWPTVTVFGLLRSLFFLASVMVICYIPFQLCLSGMSWSLETLLLIAASLLGGLGACIAYMQADQMEESIK